MTPYVLVIAIVLVAFGAEIVDAPMALTIFVLLAAFATTGKVRQYKSRQRRKRLVGILAQDARDRYMMAHRIDERLTPSQREYRDRYSRGGE